MNAFSISCKQFAFVIPTYNYSEFIVRAVDSIINQGGGDFQIIIMDDGSTDGTFDILKSRYSNYNNLYLCSQKNQGPNAAGAEAIRVSNAEYIIFMASDDALRPDYLENIRLILKKDPSLDMIFGRYSSIAESGKIKISQHLFPLDSPVDCFKRFIMGDLSMSTCGTLVKRDIMETYINYSQPFPHNYDTVILAHCLLKHHCYQSPDIFVDVYAHRRRFRDNHIPVIRGQTIVDIMFDQQLIGTNSCVQSFKNEFLAKYHRSNARSFYRAKMWAEARESYMLAFKLSPSCILQPNILKRFLICFIRDYFGNLFSF